MDDDTRIPTNLRVLRILEVLGTSDKPMSPTEINQALGLPKQTVHRLCKTLLTEGYLVKETNDKRLRPARRLRTLASGVLFASRFHLSRHQILIDVAAEVNETVNFVVPEEKGMTYLDRVETDWPFQILLPIGTHVPFHCTASGKTYLASLRPAARRAMVNCLNLEKLTDNTHDNVESLLQELDEVAKQGYALDNEEFVSGMVAVAVPIVDDRNRFYAALAFHGPVQRLSIDYAKANVDMLSEAARCMSIALFS